MSFPATKWVRVHRKSRCPICGRDSWCLVSPDGQRVRCKNKDFAAGGELVVGGDDEGDAWMHLVGAGGVPPVPREDRQEAPCRDFGALVEKMQRDLPPDLLERFARDMGVGVEALRLLETGWDAQKRCFAWPMRDAQLRPVGIRLRDARTGSKFAVRGSKQGLFVPVNVEAPELVLVCEGPTDTAAAMTLGFYTIGRPSCQGGINPVAKLTHGRKVVVVSDADGPGRRGAEALASAILPTVLALKVIEPPKPHKDLRAWLQAGAGRQDLVEVIRAADLRRRRTTAAMGVRT